MSSRLEVNPMDFDNRMIEWNLKHNKITREQLKTYLASLADDAANSENLNIEEGDSTSSTS